MRSHLTGSVPFTKSIDDDIVFNGVRIFEGWSVKTENVKDTIVLCPCPTGVGDESQSIPTFVSTVSTVDLDTSVD